MRTTPELQFLDAQIFPEWPSLFHECWADAQARPEEANTAATRLSTIGGSVNYWLPDSPEERRAGFYVCTEILQLMEDVYLELSLDRHYDHIDHRGWMNLFQHWSWSGMLCATWAITGSTYDPRFQRFCKRRLDLNPGSVELRDAERLIVGSTQDDRRKQAAALQRPDCLNFWEAELLESFLATRTPLEALDLPPIAVTVRSPRRSDPNPLRFNVGFTVLGPEPPSGPRALHYIRIQNHLRKMGLARLALCELTAKRGLTVRVPEEDPPVTGRSIEEARPTKAAAQDLQALIDSLRRDQPAPVTDVTPGAGATAGV